MSDRARRDRTGGDLRVLADLLRILLQLGREHELLQSRTAWSGSSRVGARKCAGATRGRRHSEAAAGEPSPWPRQSLDGCAEVAVQKGDRGRREGGRRGQGEGSGPRPPTGRSLPPAPATGVAADGVPASRRARARPTHTHSASGGAVRQLLFLSYRGVVSVTSRALQAPFTHAEEAEETVDGIVHGVSGNPNTRTPVAPAAYP